MQVNRILVPATITGVSAMIVAVFWGSLPIYFKMLPAGVSSMERLMHRIVWAALGLLVVTIVSGRIGRLLSLRRRPRVVPALTTAALCVKCLTTNWLSPREGTERLLA